MDSLKGEVVKRALRLGLIWKPGLLSELIRKEPELERELNELERKFKEACERGDRQECIEILDMWERILLRALGKREKDVD